MLSDKEPRPSRNWFDCFSNVYSHTQESQINELFAQEDRKNREKGRKTTS